MTNGSLLSHYKNLLSGATADAPSAEGGFEGFAAGPSAQQISGRLEKTKAELYRIVREHLGDDPKLRDIVDKITADANEGLFAVASNDEDRLADPNVAAGLEVIVRTDGSRPSFMVRGGMPDLTTSPVGVWRTVAEDEPEVLRAALACVGRIDDPDGAQGFQGTGSLIGENLIMTNRHVLQAIASQDRSGTWTVRPNITVDFGHEFKARQSVGPRKIQTVAFAGAEWIDPYNIDHKKLDLALLELEPATAGARPKTLLEFDTDPDWANPNRQIVVVGYPGDPGPGVEAPSLLERLFLSTYGCKRYAPGLVGTVPQKLPDSPRGWTLGHDATTLGGNSGSAVLLVGRSGAAAGLHYGGRRSVPRENWCHLLGRTLDDTDGRPNSKPLRRVLADYGVSFRAPPTFSGGAFDVAVRKNI